MDKKGKAVGIIMTYKCSNMLEGLLSRIPRGYLDELIIVDDNYENDPVGLEDRRKNKTIAEKYNIAFFPHEHLGYGGNLKWGLRKAVEMGADYCFELHGDNQYGPEAVPAALEKMHQGADFVSGSRFTNWKQTRADGMPWSRFLANIGLSFFSRLVLQIPWSEFYSGFRVYNKKLVQIAGNKGENSHLFSMQVTVLARYHNLKFDEVPVRGDYLGEHTSISIWESTVYSFHVFYYLTLYLLARFGIKTKLFK